MISFYDKLRAVCMERDSRVALLIVPRIDKLPPHIARYDEPFLPFGKEIVRATRDLVAAYVFDLPSYMALGAVGMVALERTIDYATDSAVTILHGAFALDAFTIVSDENAFGVDAVTLAPGMAWEPFVTRADRGAFVIDAWAGDRYELDTGRMVCGDLTLQVTDEAFLYMHRLPDFADVLAANVEALRNAH
jgi:hypothetical protein